MKIALPEISLKLIDSYKNIKMGPYVFVCPYFQNKSIKAFWSVFLGKGSPKNIESIANKLYIKYKPNNSISAKNLLIKCNIGIDCSGFVLNVVLASLQKPLAIMPFLIKPLTRRPLSVLRHYLRFFTNISANTLTSDKNCINIREINDILPGDLIRTGKVHVGIITEVVKDRHKVISFKYSHSISGGAKKIGISEGKVVIIDPDIPLEKQKWIEKNQHMLRELTNAPRVDSGIRRLKSFRISVA